MNFRNSRSECRGVPVVTCREKLGQTIVQVMRVIFGYFLMLCVMTMNVWLLTSVVVGAFVGYGVGKPIVANSIHDSVTSYGYESAAVGIFRRGNRRSEVSRSWKFQAVSDAHMQFEQTGALLSKPNNTQNADRLSTGSDVVWLRRSSEDIASATSTDRIQKDRDKDDPAESLGASNFDSINSEGTGSSRSFSRFRSTSKVINDSFRSQRSYSQLTKQSSNASVFTQESPQLRPKHLQASRTSSKVSRASSTSSGRFKPVSKQIRRQMSFNDDSG